LQSGGALLHTYTDIQQGVSYDLDDDAHISRNLYQMNGRTNGFALTKIRQLLPKIRNHAASSQFPLASSLPIEPPVFEPALLKQGPYQAASYDAHRAKVQPFVVSTFGLAVLKLAVATTPPPPKK